METTLITAIAEDGGAARTAMTTTERERCSGFVLPQRRRDFRAGRLAAKRAAGLAVGGCPPRRIEVATAGDGSPRLMLIDRSGRSRPAPLGLSISHRDGRAVAAAAPSGLRVGVDLERTHSVPHRMGRYFLTQAEQELDVTDTTLLWSLKEAAWKAVGLGHEVGFKELELCYSAEGALFGVEVRGAFLPMNARVEHPWPRYHAVTVWMTGGGA